MDFHVGVLMFFVALALSRADRTAPPLACGLSAIRPRFRSPAIAARYAGVCIFGGSLAPLSLRDTRAVFPFGGRVSRHAPARLGATTLGRPYRAYGSPAAAVWATTLWSPVSRRPARYLRYLVVNPHSRTNAVVSCHTGSFAADCATEKHIYDFLVCLP